MYVASFIFNEMFCLLQFLAVFTTTSSNVCNSGLQRALFLPFVDLLLAKAVVFSFYPNDHKDSDLYAEGGGLAAKDYRLIKHSLDHNEVRGLLYTCTHICLVELCIFD